MTRTRHRISARAIAIAFLAALAAPVVARPASAQLLLVNPMTIGFPSSDPDTTPVVSASPIRITYLVLAPVGRPWTITVRAGGALTSGASTIPISTVSWIASPSPPFRSGTLSTVAQTLATGSGLAILQSGDVTFRFANSWNYTVGNYTQTVTFTLTSP